MQTFDKYPYPEGEKDPVKAAKYKKQLHKIVIFAGIALAIVVALVIAGNAYAQDMPAVIEPPATWTALWLQVVFYAISSVVAMLIGWASLWMKQKFNIDIEAKHREALHSAAMTGVSMGMRKYAQARAAAASSSVVNSRVPDRKAMIEDTALEWVQRSVPDALKAFGIGPGNLIGMLLPIIQSKAALLENSPNPVIYTEGSNLPGG